MVLGVKSRYPNVIWWNYCDPRFFREPLIKTSIFYWWGKLKNPGGHFLLLACHSFFPNIKSTQQKPVDRRPIYLPTYPTPPQQEKQMTYLFSKKLFIRRLDIKECYTETKGLRRFQTWLKRSTRFSPHSFLLRFLFDGRDLIQPKTCLSCDKNGESVDWWNQFHSFVFMKH